MNDSRNTPRTRWAPWWAYLIPILGINYLRQALVAPADVGNAISVALFAATTAVVAVVVTFLYRLLR